MVAFPEVGSAVPHLTVVTADGRRVEDADIRQREQLLLVVLPHARTGPWAAFEEQLETARGQFQALETRLVLSCDRVGSVDGPLACVADRWGEVTHVAGLRPEGGRVIPEVATLLQWVEATLHRCPECEGEAS
jgi:hypothetical protein